MFVTSTSEAQIDKMYDVYIVGELISAGEDDLDGTISGDDSSDQAEKIKAFHRPFKIKIGEPYWLAFNTAPTVDWVPNRLQTKAGSSVELKFGEAYDFENNNVFLDSVDLRSEDFEPDLSWLTINNSTVFDEVSIRVSVPKELF